MNRDCPSHLLYLGYKEEIGKREEEDRDREKGGGGGGERGAREGKNKKLHKAFKPFPSFLQSTWCAVCALNVE